MLAALCHEAFALFLRLAAAPTFKPHPHKAHPPPADERQELWFWVEDHAEIVYPAVGFAIIVLILLGVRRGMKSNVAEAAEKEARRDAIIRMMRGKLLVTPEDVAGELHIDRFRASAMLEELVADGKLVQQRMAGGIAHYRLKGL